MYDLNYYTMEAEPVTFRHWEDVVFENRNKLYGAYLLRKTYNKHLLSGMGATVAFVSVILSLNEMHPDQPLAKIIPPLKEETVVDIKHPPLFDRLRKHPVQQEPQTKTDQVIITREEVIERDTVEVVVGISSDDDLKFGDVGDVSAPQLDGRLSASDVPPVVEPEPVIFAEVMPSYEGGFEAMMKFIRKKIKYPRAPKHMGIEGTVYVGFVVGENGSVKDVHIVRGVHPDYDQEAMRVISMLPPWRSGSHNGRPVAVRMVLPIKFDLTGQ